MTCKSFSFATAETDKYASRVYHKKGINCLSSGFYFPVVFSWGKTRKPWCSQKVCAFHPIASILSHLSCFLFSYLPFFFFHFLSTLFAIIIFLFNYFFVFLYYSFFLSLLAQKLGRLVFYIAGKLELKRQPSEPRGRPVKVETSP